MRIKNIGAREIMDSNQNPTLELTVILENNLSANASVPSGASTGENEALELRDGDKARYHGKGVTKAIKNVTNVISPKLKGLDVQDQAKIDKTMIGLDGTRNKARLGANAIIGVSLAIARTAANSQKMPLYQYIRKISQLKNGKLSSPVPMMVMIEGGKHGKGNNISFQEFSIIAAVDEGKKVWQALKEVLTNQDQDIILGLEGGFAPKISSNREAMEFLTTAISAAGFRPGDDIGIALDVAASELYKKDKYVVGNKKLSSIEMIDFMQDLAKKYPIFSIEDGLSQHDWDGWTKLNAILGNKIKIIGDDIFVTNLEKLQLGIKRKAANAILIKPNQIGTLTETLQAVKTAQEGKMDTIVSHRSGETLDTFIADLAVGTGSIMLKSGAPSYPERMAKYARLKEIEKEIGEV